jgi:hypothetical protein
MSKRRRQKLVKASRSQLALMAKMRRELQRVIDAEKAKAAPPRRGGKR